MPTAERKQSCHGPLSDDNGLMSSFLPLQLHLLLAAVHIVRPHFFVEQIMCAGAFRDWVAVSTLPGRAADSRWVNKYWHLPISNRIGIAYTLYRPAAEGKHPTLLIYNMYDASTNAPDFNRQFPRTSLTIWKPATR